MSRRLLISNSTVHVGLPIMSRLKSIALATGLVSYLFVLHDQRAYCTPPEGRLSKIRFEFTSAHDVSNARRDATAYEKAIRQRDGTPSNSQL
jgi:hypothetical protein